jgi:hypothetical protein
MDKKLFSDYATVIVGGQTYYWNINKRYTYVYSESEELMFMLLATVDELQIKAGIIGFNNGHMHIKDKVKKSIAELRSLIGIPITLEMIEKLEKELK